MRYILTCLLLAGCGSIHQEPPTPSVSLKPYKLSASEEPIYQQWIRRGLRDPQSAQFSEVVAGKDERGQVLICGNVNSKNGFGGYAGRVPFFAYLYTNGPNVGYGEMAGNSFTTSYVERLCSNAGLQFIPM